MTEWEDGRTDYRMDGWTDGRMAEKRMRPVTGYFTAPIVRPSRSSR